MEFLTQLWLPIIASAAAVWIASALGWMLVNHHCKDLVPLPGEDAKLDQIRSWGLPPGCYVFPHMDKKAGCTPEGKAKWERGPMGMIRVWGKFNMGSNMIQTFIVNLVVSTLIAYLGWAAFGHGGIAFAKVFQVLGVAGILAYCFASLPGDIWFQQSKRAMVLCFIDGIVFGLITGAIFAALWPK